MLLNKFRYIGCIISTLQVISIGCTRTMSDTSNDTSSNVFKLVILFENLNNIFIHAI